MFNPTSDMLTHWQASDASATKRIIYLLFCYMLLQLMNDKWIMD